MKFIFCILLLSLSACSITADNQPKRTPYTMKSDGELAKNQRGLELINADLAFVINPKQKSISGDATLSFKTLSPRTSIGINLDSLFTIEQLQVNGDEIPNTQFNNPEGLLSIDLKEPVLDVFTVRIKYSGVPRIAHRAPWDGGFVWSKTADGQDWIATAVQGEGCDLFWPCIDNPAGEPNSVEMHITVPSNLYVAANGVFQGVTEQGGMKTYHWKTLSKHNTYGIALNIAPYDIIEENHHSIFGNQIPIVYFHLPQNTEKAKKLVIEMHEILDFFERTIGPYPFAKEKMGIVETPHLGMEHQTINAYGNEYRKDEYGFDWLLQHEFSHEWFANQLTNTNADHMWLHEGFGAYMQPLYAQYLHGDAAYKSYMYKQRKGITNKHPLVSNKTQSVEDVYKPETGPGGDIYVKGSWVLHTLRNLIGDQAFFNATKQLVYGNKDPKPGEFQPRLANTEDFLNSVNEETGQNYRWFFDVYFYQAKLPVLETHRSDNQLTLSWLVENNKPFPMPVEVAVNGTLFVLDLSVTQSLKLSPKDSVIIDPSSKLLKDETHINEYQKFIAEKKK